jgi:hypothetical protein
MIATMIILQQAVEAVEAVQRDSFARVLSHTAPARRSLPSAFLRLRGGSVLPKAHAGLTRAERRMGPDQLLPNQDVVSQSARGICAAVDAALFASGQVCAGEAPAQTLSQAETSGLRALQQLLESDGGRAREGAIPLEHTWLNRVARRIVELMRIYVGNTHELAIEILLFDSLRCTLAALEQQEQKAEEAPPQTPQGADAQERSTPPPPRTSVEGDAHDATADGVERVEVPWQMLGKRLLELHVPRLAAALLSETSPGGPWMSAGVSMRHEILKKLAISAISSPANKTRPGPPSSGVSLRHEFLKMFGKVSALSSPAKKKIGLSAGVSQRQEILKFGKVSALA